MTSPKSNLMKQTRFVLAALLLALLHLHVQAQNVYSKVKVYYDDIAGRDRIIGLLELDHFMPDKGCLTTEVNVSQLPLLQQNNIRYEVLVPDVVKNLKKLNDAYFSARQSGEAAAARVAIEQRGGTVANMIPKPTAFTVKSTFGGYYSYTEMVDAINTLVSTYPTIAKKLTLGTTYGGRAILCVKISDNVNATESDEPEVLYLGLQHAREAITGASMIFFMQYLCQFYSTDTRIRDLVNNRQIYIVPCFNPDGWEFNRTDQGGAAGGDWRKNRSPQSGSQFGVDLNRNWGVDWSNCNSPILGASSSCGSSSTSSDTYYGTSAFSEKETQAIRAFVRDSGHHFVVGFDQHSYGPYYSLPYGRKSLHTAGLPTGQKNFFTAIPALMGTYNGMRAADSYDALGYEVAGGFKDWMLMGEIGVGDKDTVYALTGEGAAGGGTPAFGSMADFWAPASQIVYLSQGMCYQNLQLAYAAGSYVDIQDTSDIVLTSMSGNMGFTVRRLGRGDDPITVTLVPLENIQTVGSPVTITSIPDYYDTRSGVIPYTLFPGLTNGQRVKFAWKVSTGGYSYTDTVTKFYNPTTLFTDDMEGSAITTKWTVTSNVTDKWAYTTLAAYGGTHAMTESPAGDYTTSTTRTVLCNSTFNLTGSTAAFLSFWVKHRAENFRDKLQVQASANGGAFTPIAGTTTIQEPGTLDGSTINGQPALTGIRDYWTRELFDLNAYRNTSLRIQMVFTSDSDPSSFKFEKDDGFYIDNVKLVSTNATLVSLPVTFISVSAKLLLNNTVDVQWEAATDRSHDRFEVERSADGVHFAGIGTVRGGSSPYDFIDARPNAGHNYYRIREVDVDGKPTYSKIVDVVYTPRSINVSVYPNPVRDVLGIKLYDDRAPETLDIIISDVQGRVIYRQAMQTQNGANETKINVQFLMPQVYLLKVTDRAGENVSIQKFIKQ